MYSVCESPGFNFSECLSGKICIYFFFITKSHYTFFSNIKKNSYVKHNTRFFVHGSENNNESEVIF